MYLSMDLVKFKKNGYVIIEDFFNPVLIQNVRDKSKEIFKTQFSRFNYSTNDIDFTNSMIELFRNEKEVFINCGKTIQ